MPAVPVKGTTDAAGADTYTAIVAARANGQPYTHCTMYCATQNAIVSFDGGTTDHLVLVAGQYVNLDDITITALSAKNETAGQNYATFVATCW